MAYAFLDESGDEIPFGGEPCLVVALLSIDQPRALELAVTRARRKYGASLASGEMKADGRLPRRTGGGLELPHRRLPGVREVAEGSQGAALSAEDIEHYQRVVVALNETIRIMGAIDAVIEAHGGWPIQ